MWQELTITNGNADTSQIIRSCDTVGIKIYGLIPNANDPNLVLATLPNGYRPIGFEGGIYCTGYGQNSLKPQSFLIREAGEIIYLADTTNVITEPLNLTVQYKLMY